MSKSTNYEAQRLKNIELNRQLLAEFDMEKAKSDLFEIPTSPTPVPLPVQVRKKNPVTGKRKSTVVPPAKRQSSRLRGIEAPTIEVSENDRIEGSNDTSEQQQNSNNDVLDNDELWDGKLLTADEYFDKETRNKAYRTNGKFTGWINPDLMAKYQFEASAREAWEKNGGGKFSYKDPLGTGTTRAKGGNGRHSARAIAHKMFKKNPNMYFYRHNEPGAEQWTGDWTEEEKEIFIKLVETYGCGDKWGLFASYIPHRVGYQCSNYYRSVILPSGIVFDDTYKYSPSGKVFYVGPNGSKSSS